MAPDSQADRVRFSGKMDTGRQGVPRCKGQGRCSNRIGRNAGTARAVGCWWCATTSGWCSSRTSQSRRKPGGKGVEAQGSRQRSLQKEVRTQIGDAVLSSFAMMPSFLRSLPMAAACRFRLCICRKWKAAITAYSAAIELVPSNHVCWANRAACHAALLQWAEAAADSEECIRLDKVRNSMQFSISHPLPARLLFKFLTLLLQTFVKAWYRLGRARLELGDIGAAVAAVEAGRPLCPEGEGGPVGARVSDFDALAAMCAEKSTQTEGSTVRGRSTS
eukprot:SAG31_NODE_927_length_10930_cov_15.134983_8_plen_276_part_00